MTFAPWTREDVESDREAPGHPPEHDECHGGCGTIGGLMHGLAECGHCGKDVCKWCRECFENWESNGQPECSICGAEIDFTEGAPLCATCEATAKAHAAVAVSMKRYRADMNGLDLEAP